MDAQQGRPGRKRDASRDAAILQATLDVLADAGYERMTTDMVAARAGTSKATMYRRWQSKAELVVDAVESLRSEPSAAVDTGSLATDLVALLEKSTDAPAHRKFEVMMGLLSVLPHDPDLASAVQRQVVHPRTTAIRQAILREQARGGLPEGCDVDLLVEVVMATITYRTIITGQPVDGAFLTALVEKVLNP